MFTKITIIYNNNKKIKKIMTNIRRIHALSCYKPLNDSQLYDSSKKVFSFSKSLRANILHRIFSSVIVSSKTHLIINLII